MFDGDRQKSETYLPACLPAYETEMQCSAVLCSQGDIGEKAKTKNKIKAD